MRVIISPYNVVNYPEGGGHFWVYMQYVEGLRQIGCDVWWIEEFRPSADAQRDAARVRLISDRLAQYGLLGKLILYTAAGEYLNTTRVEAEAIFRSADLLLNFHQLIRPWMLANFRRTALVDIDPGLLQYWISSGMLSVAAHDLYFTTGETVGTPEARFPDCGLRWIPIRPPVSLELWPYAGEHAGKAFSTVSSWWGGEWVDDGREVYDNNKRASFLQFADLPSLTSVPLELALFLDSGSPSDNRDRELLIRKGWRIRHSHEVAATPEDYRTYIRQSRGEFSCAKASCMRFRNAWVSDRTLCYLASGRPAVVQDTGPSRILPNGLGLFRFSTLEEAAGGLEAIASNYARHSRAARELAEAHFDARRIAETIVASCG